MDKNIEKIINEIVWWIPFKKLRNNIRSLLFCIIDNKTQPQLPISYTENAIKYDHNIVIDYRNAMINDQNFLSKYKRFVSNLDQDSLTLVSNIFSYICNFNNIYDYAIMEEKKYEELKYMNDTFKNNIFKVDDNTFAYERYILPKNIFLFHIFFEKYGIDKIKNKDMLKNKNIIDAGGYIGDTALLFSYYTDKNVYTFEPLINNYNDILKTIQINGKNNIIPFNMALGDTDQDIFLDIDRDVSMLCYGEDISNNDSKKYKVPMIRLDKFVEENNIEVGLIKTDLEGFEQIFLKGAINTIKKQKPILLISIYHSYDDFFNIKFLIENLNLGYKFSIFKPREISVVVETMLLAEPYQT
ncbi:FkbM family methyltransferase [Brachyspira pilosicoli]|uniref:FkbM family methyltransferase n=1 Tax=Brachyspira pilosicoli TaxID=52584 RepID=UPI002542AD3C|nr:FkbM family methyltransferase [Brachyspira pilosicoli]WIH84151.1 FkbM family methyltransferase [Brachyspira pilosicoli]